MLRYKFINKQRFCSLYRIDTYEQAEGLKARRKEQISEFAEETQVRAEAMGEKRFSCIYESVENCGSGEDRRDA